MVEAVVFVMHWVLVFLIIVLTINKIGNLLGFDTSL